MLLPAMRVRRYWASLIRQSGNVQGVQNSTGVVDLVSSSQGTTTDYTSEESELFPGGETGA